MLNFRIISNKEFLGSTGDCGDNYRDFATFEEAKAFAKDKKVANPEFFKKSDDYDNWEQI